MKVLIVGAGLAGLTAGVLLKRKGWDVRVLETRNEPGGNCADYLYQGVHVHQYGPHIFHTSDMRVWQFINEFTGMNNYLHRVVAKTNLSDKLLPIPYSKATAQELGRELTDEEIRNGFFLRYSEKMWGRPYSEIPASITSRVPLRRDNFDTGYFQDKWQGMPAAGYSALFIRMVDEIGRANVEFAVKEDAWRAWHDSADLVVYTGRLDEFWEYEYGELPYRAVTFEFRRAQPRQGHAVINWCDDRPATRTTDFSYFYDNKNDLTVTCAEYPSVWVPQADMVPSYPMKDFPEAHEKFVQYIGLHHTVPTVFCGRLAAYKYMNMDAVIADTMVGLEKTLGERLYG